MDIFINGYTQVESNQVKEDFLNLLTEYNCNCPQKFNQGYFGSRIGGNIVNLFIDINNLKIQKVKK